jgi:hypothetical protein
MIHCMGNMKTEELCQTCKKLPRNEVQENAKNWEDARMAHKEICPEYKEYKP